MKITITPTELSGGIAAPVSKSSAHRLLICAALGKFPVRLRFGGAVPEDIEATWRCLEGLGADIRREGNEILVTPIDRKAPIPEEPLDCGESGSTLRFLIPVAAALGGVRRFRLRGRLPERPLSPLKEELERHGAVISLEGDILTVCGDRMSGTDFVIDGDVSSQFISGLLFAASLIGGGAVRVTGKIESRPYVDMTVQTLRDYGVKITEEDGSFNVSPAWTHPQVMSAEGDWSGGAFFICAGALSTEGVTVLGLNEASLHGDRKCLDILRSMGAVVESLPDGVTVRRGSLRGTVLDATDIPDLVPIVAATCAAAEGDTTITGVSRLRLKESDRIETTCNMINAMGGCAEGDDDSIRIKGGLGLPLSEVDPCGDHRIAMAAAILASAAKGSVRVKDAECVKKSYPEFWEDYRLLKGNISPCE